VQAREDCELGEGVRMRSRVRVKVKGKVFVRGKC
jgi:hypothetical protein